MQCNQSMHYLLIVMALLLQDKAITSLFFCRVVELDIWTKVAGTQ